MTPVGCRYWATGRVKAAQIPQPALSSALVQADLEPASKQKGFAHSFPQPASNCSFNRVPSHDSEQRNSWARNQDCPAPLPAAVPPSCKLSPFLLLTFRNSQDMSPSAARNHDKHLLEILTLCSKSHTTALAAPFMIAFAPALLHLCWIPAVGLWAKLVYEMLS